MAGYKKTDYLSDISLIFSIELNIYLTKITATQNEVDLTYHRVRGLYYLAVIFVATIGLFYFSIP